MKRPLSTYLLLALLLLFIGGVSYNGWKLFNIYQENQRIENQVNNAGQIRAEVEKLNRSLAINPISIAASLQPIKNEIFDQIGKVQKNLSVQVLKVEQVEDRQVKDYSLVSFGIELTGNYANMLKALEYLELNLRSSKLSSATFFVDKDMKSGKSVKNLKLKIYVQGVIKA